MSERWLAVFYRPSIVVTPDRPADEVRPDVPAEPVESEWLGWDAWVLPDGPKPGSSLR